MSLLHLPSITDIHVHLRDPGDTHKEDFYTGTEAALNGGITSVFDMPNNKIPVFTEEALREKENIAKEKAVCDYGFYFGSTGKNIDEFDKVVGRVVGLKLYLDQTTGNYLISDLSLIREIFSRWPKQKIIVIHGEGENVSLVLKLAKQLGNKIHITHVTTRADLERIMEAKKMSLPVTCDVTPHHLFLTEKDAVELKGKGQVKPPLSSLADKVFLWNYISWIDCFASDHAPHTEKEKNSESPPYGIPGLDTMLPLLLTEVKNGKLLLNNFIEKTSTNPRKIFGLKKENDSYTEVDTEENWEVKKENLKSKCAWSPFEGWQIHGKIKSVYIRGKKVMENGNILAEKGFGRNVMLP